MNGRIFLSYRRDDSGGYAGRLNHDLSQHFGEQHVFMDIWMDLGDDFVKLLEEELAQCSVVIVMIGKRWLGEGDGKRKIDDPEDYPRRELARALARQVLVVPVLLDGATMPAASSLPSDIQQIGRRNALQVSNSDWNANVARLFQRIERELGVRAKDSKVGPRHPQTVVPAPPLSRALRGEKLRAATELPPLTAPASVRHTLSPTADKPKAMQPADSPKKLELDDEWLYRPPSRTIIASVAVRCLMILTLCLLVYFFLWLDAGERSTNVVLPLGGIAIIAGALYFLRRIASPKRTLILDFASIFLYGTLLVTLFLAILVVAETISRGEPLHTALPLLAVFLPVGCLAGVALRESKLFY